jgi:hypothetical protein
VLLFENGAEDTFAPTRRADGGLYKTYHDIKMRISIAVLAQLVGGGLAELAKARGVNSLPDSLSPATHSSAGIMRPEQCRTR